MRNAGLIIPMTVAVCFAATAGQVAAGDWTGRLQAVASDLARLSATPGSPADAYFAAVTPLGFAEQADYEAELASKLPTRTESRPTSKLLPVAMLLDAVLGKASAETLKTIADAQGENPSAIYFEEGPVFLDDIRSAMANLPNVAASEHEEGDVSLSRPLVLSSRAVLVLQPGEHLTLNRAAGAFIVAAGGMIVDKAKISGSDAPNLAEDKFRPFILADATIGPVELSSSQISHLGFGNDPRAAGLSITGGDAGGERRSFVQDSAFTDVGSLSLVDVTQSTIRRNVFHRSTNTALSIVTSSSVIIDGNAVIEPVLGHGVKLGPSAAKVLLSDNIVAGSERHGLLIEGSTDGSVVFNNLLFQNHASGVAVLAGLCLSLEQNVTLANADDGIMVRDSARLSLETNIISANGRAGLSVAGNSGSLLLDDNRFSSNKIGLRASASFELTLSNNDWTGQTPRLLDGDVANYTLPLLAAIKAGKTELSMAGLPLPSAIAAASQTCESREAI